MAGHTAVGLHMERMPTNPRAHNVRAHTHTRTSTRAHAHPCTSTPSSQGMKWSIRSLRMFMETRHSADSTNELFHNIQVSAGGGRRGEEKGECTFGGSHMNRLGCHKHGAGTLRVPSQGDMQMRVMPSSCNYLHALLFLPCCRRTSSSARCWLFSRP